MPDDNPDLELTDEQRIDWEPRARDFPRRNRLISGLAVGVVVIEAARRSGSLITARMALEQGREVFAVPGSPLDPRCEGSNGLLKQGATLVTEAADVIAVLQPILGQPIDLPAEEPEPARSPARNQPRTSARSIVGLLGPTPVGLDDLVRLSGARPRSCARCCWNSRSPAGWSATAAAWSRCCRTSGSAVARPLAPRVRFSASSCAISRR